MRFKYHWKLTKAANTAKIKVCECESWGIELKKIIEIAMKATEIKC